MVRTSGTDVDNRTASFNAPQVCYFSECLYIFWVQTVPEIGCYCFKCV